MVGALMKHWIAIPTCSLLVVIAACTTPSPTHESAVYNTKPQERELLILESPSLNVLHRITLRETKLVDHSREMFLSWSPDGKSLAYLVEGELGETDVYLYHQVDNSVKHIIEAYDVVSIMGWSPDSSWLILMSGEDNLQRALAVRVLNGEVKLAYDAGWDEPYFYWGYILDWTSNSTFVVVEGYGEECDTVIREVNAPSGTSRTLFEPALRWAAIDPKGGTIFFGIGETGMCEYTLEPGIYRMALNDPTPRRVVEGTEWRDIYWSPEIEQFQINRSDPRGITTFTPAGNQKLQFENAASILPSPDGRWILVELSNGEGLMLADQSGTILREIYPERIEQMLWHPDSHSFFITIDKDQILYRADMEGAWETKTIAEGIRSVTAIVEPKIIIHPLSYH